MSKNPGPKIVLFDLETLPNFSETMKVWPKLGNYPGLTLKASITSIICFGYKVLGEKKTNCINAWDFKTWRRDQNNDKALVKQAYEILMTADAVVTHNGKKFDWKFFQTRLAIHGLPMLPKIKHVDTRQVASKNLYLFNNSLDIVAKALTNTKKMENGGWDLWVDVYNRKPAALKLMTAYCKQDVVALENVFNKLRRYTNDIPNFNFFRRDGAACCPNCGGFKLRSLGWNYLATTKRKRFMCNSCGTAFSDGKTMPKV